MVHIPQVVSACCTVLGLLCLCSVVSVIDLKLLSESVVCKEPTRP